ncbi:MAG: hypothetical protein H7Z17_13800 [Fuerstia sp.]|nr:hypothetical protein [Fuerstiella sp.]
MKNFMPINALNLMIRVRPFAVANVAFRSAKAAFFRGAKGDTGSAILNRATNNITFDHAGINSGEHGVFASAAACLLAMTI